MMVLLPVAMIAMYTASYYNKVCNYANLRKRSKPIWKAKERSD